MIALIKHIAILCILIFASITDFKKREVPYTYIILIALTALIDFQASHMLGIIVSVPFYFAEKDGRCMGGGDVMAVAALGFSLGVRDTLSVVIIGCIVFISAGIVHEYKKGESKSLFPFIPALTAGYIVTMILEVVT